MCSFLLSTRPSAAVAVVLPGLGVLALAAVLASRLVRALPPVIHPDSTTVVSFPVFRQPSQKRRAEAIGEVSE